MATRDPKEGSLPDAASSVPPVQGAAFPDPPAGGAAGGDSDRFFSEVYGELRSIARRRMRGERRGRTIQSTELVHEAYLRLRKDQGREWETPGHFFAAAAEAMRRILIDRARARRRLKRGADSGGMPARQLTLDLREVAELADQDDPESILAFDRALDRLGAQDERLMSTVKLRFYAGLSVEETAEALQVSPRTVKRDWAFARAWLFDHLRAEAGGKADREDSGGQRGLP
jgi:RNA polymerase sigma factor (TIGR02999 family)